MILKFKFEYLANNDTLISFLNNICKSSKVEYRIQRQNDIFLYVAGEEKELIEFSNTLDATLPMSMFFRNSTAEVVSQMPQENLVIESKEYKLPFCSSCLIQIEDENSENFYNPFLSCQVCGTTCDVKTLKLLEDNKELEYNSNKELFEKVASLINENKAIKIKTQSGEFVFRKLAKTDDTVKLLALDLSTISNLVVAQKSEVVALASIEKPSIDLTINAVFKQKEILTQEKVNLRYCNDLSLYLLAKELEKYEIDFLIYDENSAYDLELTFDGDIKNIDIPKVKILNNQVVVLESNSYDKNLDVVYSKFDEPSKAHFMVLLQEHNAFDKTILNFYSSSKENDGISIYSKDVESFLDVVSYELPNSVEEIFNEIAKDETGARLVQNYKNKFPEIYEKAMACDLSELKDKNIYSLWKIVAVVLGFEEKIIEKCTVLENGMACALDKGPRIDYRFEDSVHVYNKTFLTHKLFQSGLSFKLTGMDDNTLSLGYVESFAHYVAKIVDDVHMEIPLAAACLTGDIFSNDLISKLVHKSVTKNFKIYYNKEFVIQK